MTQAVFWALVSVTVIVVTVLGAGRFLAARRTRADDLGAHTESLRHISVACRLDGHAYREQGIGFRCATCGNHVSRMEGELYGVAEDDQQEDITRSGDSANAEAPRRRPAPKR